MSHYFCRFEQKFSKRTQQWCAVKVLKPKTYGYIPNLIKRVFEKKEVSQAHVSDKIGVLHDDPQRIMPNISAILPPPVQSLVEAHQSRFE